MPIFALPPNASVKLPAPGAYPTFKEDFRRSGFPVLVSLCSNRPFFAVDGSLEKRGALMTALSNHHARPQRNENTGN
jgi:hypothetical protein